MDHSHSELHIHHAPGSEPKGIVGTYAPLAFMFVLVGAFVFARQFSGVSPDSVMYDVMGGYFLAFGLLKVFNLKGFVDSYKAYDWLAKNIPFWAYVYPFVELLLAVAYISGFGLIAASVVTFVLMTQKAWSVFIQLRSGGVVMCACLGGFFMIPVTWVTFAEDGVMALMGLSVLLLLQQS